MYSLYRRREHFFSLFTPLYEAITDIIILPQAFYLGYVKAFGCNVISYSSFFSYPNLLSECVKTLYQYTKLNKENLAFACAKGLAKALVALILRT